MKFGVWGSDFGVSGSDFGVWGSNFGVWGSDFGVWGSDFLGFGVQIFGVWGSDFGVWGLDFGSLRSLLTSLAAPPALDNITAFFCTIYTMKIIFIHVCIFTFQNNTQLG